MFSYLHWQCEERGEKNTLLMCGQMEYSNTRMVDIFKSPRSIISRNDKEKEHTLENKIWLSPHMKRLIYRCRDQ